MTSPASPEQPAPPAKINLTVRALLVGERIDVASLERSDVISTAPLAFRLGNGYAVLFRYGVVVLIGLSPIEEDEILRGLQSRITRPFEKIDEEVARIEIASGHDDQIPAGGPIQIKDLSPPRLVVIADALAKNVVLTRGEREVRQVFDVIEPLAGDLARGGKTPFGRKTMVRLIGRALLVRQHLTGRVEVEEKPDVLWDRWDLERLHARLADEFELEERALALSGKLEVIGETAQTLTDLIDTSRTVRLEIMIVVLIVIEVLFTIYELFFRTTARM